MKKLLGLMICLCALFALSVGTTGCKKPDKTKTEAEKKVEAAAKETAAKEAAAKEAAAKEAAAKEAAAKAGTETTSKEAAAKEAAAKEAAAKEAAAKEAAAKEAAAKEAAAKEKPAKLVDVNIKAHEGEVSVTKKGDTKVTVELTEPAPENLTIKAWAKDVDAKILTGKGMIKKGEKSGDVTITTVDAPDTISEVTIEISPTDKTKAATLKLRTKVKAK